MASKEEKDLDEREKNLAEKEKILAEKTEELLKRIDAQARFPDANPSAEFMNMLKVLTETLETTGSRRRRRRRKPVIPPKPYVETYHEVVFHGRPDENATEGVEVGVMGLQLHIRREDKVILPKSILEAIEHGEYPIFRQQPGVPRKIIKKIKFYNFTPTNRVCTEDDFRKMLDAGNSMQARFVEQVQGTQI